MKHLLRCAVVLLVCLLSFQARSQSYLWCSTGGSGFNQWEPCTPSNPLAVTPSPSPTPSAGITPGVAGSASSSLVLKAAAGNLYSVYANSTVSGYLMVFNATSAPMNGSTTAGVAANDMVQCVGPSTNPFLSFNPGPPEVYSVGITAAFSSTGCATLTLSATAFIHGSVQ
jgi:hypothetical protein